jgi:hypothetical protein
VSSHAEIIASDTFRLREFIYARACRALGYTTILPGYRQMVKRHNLKVVKYLISSKLKFLGTRMKKKGRGVEQN